MQCLVKGIFIGSVARGILLKYNHTSLAEFGRDIKTRPWGNGVLRRMEYTKRSGSSTAKVLPSNSEEIKKPIDIMQIFNHNSICPYLGLQCTHPSLSTKNSKTTRHLNAFSGVPSHERPLLLHIRKS